MINFILGLALGLAIGSGMVIYLANYQIMRQKENHLGRGRKWDN